MGIIFDKPTKIITIESPTTEVDVSTLLDAIRVWESDLTSLDIKSLATAAGNEDLGGGVRVGLTLTLLDGWRVGFEARLGPEYIQCRVAGGNIVTFDGSSPIYPTAFTQVVVTASSSATSSDQEAIQYSSYGDGVSINVTSSNSGTNYPMGNREYPVNNLLDAVWIADNRGFKKLYIEESMTLGDGVDIEEFTLEGRSSVNTIVTIEDSAYVHDIHLENMNVSGILDGGTSIHDCNVGNITYVNGNIKNSSLFGTITLSGNLSAVFTNCTSDDPNNTPIIDLGGSGQNAVFTNYSGRATFKNMADAASIIAIQIDGGDIILDPTITAGNVQLTGIGEFFDNSTSLTSLNISGLLNVGNITKSTWDTATADHTTDGSIGNDVAKKKDVINASQL
jgi:hypothetical protein